MVSICVGADHPNHLMLSKINVPLTGQYSVQNFPIYQYLISEKIKNFTPTTIKIIEKNEKYIFYRKLKEFMRNRNITIYPVLIYKNGIWHTCSKETDMYLIPNIGSPTIIAGDPIKIEWTI